MRNVLVLNRNWEAVAIWNLEKAINKLFSFYKNGEPKAVIIDPYANYQTYTWSDWAKLIPTSDEKVIKSSKSIFKLPEIIYLSRYNKKPVYNSSFSRRALYLRDKYTCMYCNTRPGSEELTIDHVMPKSRGGKSEWTNCVISCVDCNFKKANRTPEEAGMTLLKQPYKPKVSLLKFEPSKAPKSWQTFISDAYWNVELQN